MWGKFDWFDPVGVTHNLTVREKWPIIKSLVTSWICCDKCCVLCRCLLVANSQQQADSIIAARSNLLAELHRVAADWQRVLPNLALQLLQVPRAQWHTVRAVQAMVTNLAAEREAVVGFLHVVMDEVSLDDVIIISDVIVMSSKLILAYSS